MKNHNITRWLGMLVILLSSCSGRLGMGEEAANSDFCILPRVGATYPVELGDSKDTEIPPQYPWKEIASLNGYLDESIVPNSEWYGVFVPSGANEVWVMVSFEQEGSENEAAELWKYLPDKAEWVKKPGALDVFYPDVSHIKIIETKKGSIFAIQEMATGIGPAGVPNLIARYNGTKEQFELIEFNDPLPDGKLLFDMERDLFWGISRNGAIYKMDPEELTVEEYSRPEEPRAYMSITIYKDSIYALREQNASSPDNVYFYNIIYKFNIETRQEEIITNPIIFDDPYLDIFLDHAGNLWLNDHSMMTPEGEWYQIQRSTVFITDRDRESGQNRWLYPEIIFESSNGFLWFNSYNGKTWYDPERQKWCWFTSAYGTELVEGNKNDVWLLLPNGTLFRYEFQ